jgi:hypothetical protein
LAIAQLVVGLAMLPLVLVFGWPGLLGSLGMSVTGHFTADLSGVAPIYRWSMLVASVSVVIAAPLSLFSGVLSIAEPSKTSVRFSIGGAVCYWMFIAADLVIRWSLQVPLTFRYLTVWDVIPYVLGVIAGLIANALRSYVKVQEPLTTERSH